MKNQLSELTTEELENRLKSLELQLSGLDNKQKNFKLLLNSLYGATGNQYFRYYDVNIAASITAVGRESISFIGEYINDYFADKDTNGIDNFGKVVVYGDTDSCVGSTELNTDKGRIKIEDLYELSGKEEEIRENNFVKFLDDEIKCQSVDTFFRFSQFKPINYVMKHKVKKRLFKITVGKKEVIITEDHSLMADHIEIDCIWFRKKIVEVKPKDIDKNLDTLVLASKDNNYDIEYSNEFEIEDLGIQEEWVYDVEVQDNHNFFGNDILLHNSFYMTLENIVNKFFENKGGVPKDPRKIERFCESFFYKNIQPLIDQAIHILSEQFNAQDIHLKHNYFQMSKEVIADKAYFVKKKKYFARILNKDGRSLKEPKLKIMGLELVKRNTPLMYKIQMKKAINCILNEQKDEFVETNLEALEMTLKAPLSSIAEVKPTRGLESYLDPSQPNGWVKKTPSHIRSAIVYNRLVDELKLTKKYPHILEGDKIWFFGLHEPNIFGLKYGALPLELNTIPEEFKINDYLNVDKQYKTFYERVIGDMADEIGWSYAGKTKLDDGYEDHFY